MKKYKLWGYYHRIASFLPCSGREKRALMQSIKENVNLYLDEHPDASISQIQAHFGTPEQIALSSLQELSLPVLLRKLRIKNQILITACVAIVACCLVWSLCMIRATTESIKSINGYGEVELIIEE